MNLIVNGVTLVAPKEFQVVITDVDGETGRNANGDMVRDRITTKRRLELSWGMLTQQEISQILVATEPTFFQVSYPDPQLGQVTKTFYSGNKTSPAYSFHEKLKPWSNLKMNFIEK